MAWLPYGWFRCTSDGNAHSTSGFLARQLLGSVRCTARLENLLVPTLVHGKVVCFVDAGVSVQETSICASISLEGGHYVNSSCKCGIAADGSVGHTHQETRAQASDPITWACLWWMPDPRRWSRHLCVLGSMAHST